MSMVIRSLLRDPMLSRPLSRAIRRLDDNYLYDEWQPKRVRRMSPAYASSPLAIMDDMNRQMNEAITRMHEFVEDLENMDSLVGGTRLAGRRRDEVSLERTESGNLQLALDVGDLKPEDLKIKLVDDNLIVEGATESSGKDSYRKSQFKRWFKLPEDCNLEEIKSRLTSDNRLLIELPSNKLEESKARTIPIEMEKPAANNTLNSGHTESNSNPKSSHQNHRQQSSSSSS